MKINYGRDYKVRINENLHTYSDSTCIHRNNYLLPQGTIIWIIRDDDTTNYLVYTNWAYNFKMPMFIKNEAVDKYTTAVTKRELEIINEDEKEMEVE